MLLGIIGFALFIGPPVVGFVFYGNNTEKNKFRSSAR